MKKTTIKRGYVAPLISVVHIESSQSLLAGSGASLEQQDYESESDWEQ